MNTAVANPIQIEEKQGGKIIAAAYAIRLLRGLSSGWLGPLIPTIALIQGVSLVDAAFMVSTYFVGLFSMLLAGPVILGKAGGKNSLTLACLSYCLGFVTIAFGTGIQVLWLGSLILGASAGLSIPGGTLCVVKLSKSNAGSALNKYAILYGVGALLGPVFALMSTGTPWSYKTVYVFAAICALLVALFLHSLKNVEIIRDQTNRDETIKLFKERSIWFFALLLFMHIGLESSCGAWLYVFLKGSCLLSQTWASFGVTALYIGLTAGRVISVELCKRFRSEKLILSSLMLTAVAFTILLLKPELPVLALALVFVLGIGLGPVFPNIIATATSIFPNKIGVTTSTLMICGVPGGIIFPWLVGVVGESNGMFLGMAALLIVNLVLVLLLATKEKLQTPVAVNSQ